MQRHRRLMTMLIVFVMLLGTLPVSAATKDEKGVADVFYEFHPVGVGFKKSTYSKKIRSKATVKTMFYDSKKRNLKRCHINANHRSREIWTLNAEILSERWKR